MTTTNSLEKITISIGKELSKQLMETLKLMRKTYGKPKMSRPEMIREILVHYVTETSDEKQTHEKLVATSNKLEKNGMEASTKGDYNKARQLFLLSAAKEIEALASLTEFKESDIKSSLIRTVILLKDGTGYQSLPDVPARNKKQTGTEIYSG